MSLALPVFRVGFILLGLLVVPFFAPASLLAAGGAPAIAELDKCRALLDAAGIGASQAVVAPELRDWLNTVNRRKNKPYARVRLSFYREEAKPRVWARNVSPLDQTEPAAPSSNWLTARQFEAAVTLLNAAVPAVSRVKLLPEPHRIDRGTVVLYGASDRVARLLADLKVPALKRADLVLFQNSDGQPSAEFAWLNPVRQPVTAAFRREIEHLSETETKTVAVEVASSQKPEFLFRSLPFANREDSGTDPWIAPTRLIHVEATRGELLNMMTWPDVLWAGNTPHGLIPTWQLDPQYRPSDRISEAEGTFLIASSVYRETIAQWIAAIRANVAGEIKVISAKQTSPNGPTFVRLSGPSKSIFWANDLMERAGLFLMHRHIQFPESAKISYNIDLVGSSPDLLHSVGFQDPRAASKVGPYRAKLATYGAYYDELGGIMIAHLTRDQILEIGGMRDTRKILAGE